MGLPGDINPPLIHQVLVRAFAGAFKDRYTHTRVKIFATDPILPIPRFPPPTSWLGRFTNRTGYRSTASICPPRPRNRHLSRFRVRHLPSSYALSTGQLTPIYLVVANNFWGKDDAGVGPLLERMHGAKTTCDELKAFYSGMRSHTTSGRLAVFSSSDIL